LVSATTLFGAGLAVIAIVALAAVVVVQQIALENVSKQSSTSAHITPQISTIQPPAPYLLIRYFGWVYAQLGDCTPSHGNVYLDLHIEVENHGYNRVPIASTTFGNPCPYYYPCYYPYYFHLTVGNQQFNGFPMPCGLSSETLPMTDVLNGLSVRGSLTFEVPANFGTYSLIYQPPTGNYSVQYVNEGFTTGTIETVTT
jgi:hypothetical protein